MNKSARLSLQTVSLMHRAVALVPALLTAMLLFAPAASLRREVDIEFYTSRADQLWSDFVSGASLMVEFFPYAFWTGLLFWGLPGFVLLHFVLKWLRGSFCATVIAGALCGVLGLHFMKIALHGPAQALFQVFSDSSYLLDDLIVGTICGGAGAALAWCYMWLASRRRRRSFANG